MDKSYRCIDISYGIRLSSEKLSRWLVENGERNRDIYVYVELNNFYWILCYDLVLRIQGFFFVNVVAIEQ